MKPAIYRTSEKFQTPKRLKIMKTTANGTTAAQVNNNRESMNAANTGASYNPDNVAHVKIYADNTREIWDQQDNTARALAKKMRQGLTPDREYLANSPSVRRIVSEAAKIARRDEWCNPTAADLQQVRREVAAYIIDELAAWKVKENED